jgi:hypothetical protein
MILDQDFYANKAIKTFSWEKTSPFPTLPFCMNISWQIKETLVLCGRLDYMYFWEIFASFKIANTMMQVDKVCLRILWTWPAWHTCPGWYCNPQLLQPWFSTNLHSSPLPLQRNSENFSWISAKKFLNNDIHIRLAAITLNYRDGNSTYNLLLSRAFSVGIPLTVDLGRNLLLS